MRTYLADGADAERILTAARKLRQAAGTLTGMAAGQDTETPAPTSRATSWLCLAVFVADPGLHWQILAARLAARFPDRWADATAESVSGTCKDNDCPQLACHAYKEGYFDGYEDGAAAAAEDGAG